MPRLVLRRIPVPLAAFGGRRGKRAALRGLVRSRPPRCSSTGVSSALSAGPVPRCATFLACAGCPCSRLRLPSRPGMPPAPARSPPYGAAELPQAVPVIAPLAAAVAYSRVYVGAHYPADVAVGAAIGVGRHGVRDTAHLARGAAPLQARRARRRAALGAAEPRWQGPHPRRQPGRRTKAAASHARRIARRLPQARVVEIGDGDDLDAV